MAIWTLSSRASYIKTIKYNLSKVSIGLLPSDSEERSYEQALSHVVSLLSSSNNSNKRRGISDGLQKPCSSRKPSCRKECLEEIMSLLQRMERNRFYDPPEDDEIRFYLLIKKYMMSICTFFTTQAGLVGDYHKRKYSVCNPLNEVQEMVELNSFLADYSECVAGLDISNGSEIKPLMGIRDNYEVTPLIHGSKERGYKFYAHKFERALLDMYCSEFAFFPPSIEEKRSYLQVLNHASRFSKDGHVGKDEMKLNSNELFLLYLDRVERELNDNLRHWKRIKTSMLQKLSLPEDWESLTNDFDFDVDSDKECCAELRNKMVEECKVSVEDLANYVTCVNRCRHITWSFTLFTNDRIVGDARESEYRSRFQSWDALHALTLFKTGRFSPGNVFREHVLLRNPKKYGIQNETKTKKRKRGAQDEDKSENVKILMGIIQDLKRIGESDAKADKEERKLMHEIWLSVIASIDFFYKAMAYEQQNHIVAIGGLSHVGKIGLRTSKMKKLIKERTNVEDYCATKMIKVDDIIEDFKNSLYMFLQSLNAYYRGLLEKLQMHRQPLYHHVV